KFLRALHPKWRAKVTAIEESKDLTSLSLDELIRNLKVHKMIIKKDFEIVKVKGERKYLASKAKKESSDEECSTSRSEDEEYAMAVRDFKKFFKRIEIPKPPKDKNQRAFVGGSWSDRDGEDDEKAKDIACFMTHASSEICLGVDLEPDEWINDSGCSKHMTGQICDNKCKVIFSEHDSEITKEGKVIGRSIKKNGLYVMKLGKKPKEKVCLTTIAENSTLWNRRLGHANMRLIQSLASKELVRNIPKLKFDQHFCNAYKIGKQAHASHKAKNIVSTTRCLELFHMDLFGPSAVQSYRGNLYTLVIVDDYSRTDHGEEFDNEVQFGEFCNTNEPKNVNEALKDESWIIAMQEELNQFIAIDIWELVPHPKSSTIKGTKWIFKNKLDENGVVSRNKARLVAQGYNQQEGSDYDETYALVSRLDYIRILLAYACALDFKLFQMDGKSAFLNGFINEEVHVAQPTGFIDFEKPNHVYKLKKDLYGLKQAPKAWYPKGTGIETVVYADFDYAEDYVDRKSTSGICTFVGCCLTSWFSKKQTALAISTNKAEYVSAGKACQQALWMKQALIDYNIRLDDVQIMCDNKGTIDLSKNLVQHTQTKHIEIRHHFLRDNVQNGHFSIEKVLSVDNIADILSKPFNRESFNYIRLGLRMMEHIP
ncbi:copia protein, partial [Tanacetum coccineum]